MQLTTSWMERSLEQERRSAITSLMKLRYDSIGDRLAAIIPALMELDSHEYNRLLLQLSKEELIKHFNTNRQ